MYGHVLIWMALLLPLVSSESTAENSNDELLQWVRAQGGYFHPHLELRSDEENGLFGVFAAEDIPENELLASIPWDCILYSDDSDDRYENCEVVKLLDKELHKQAPSLHIQSLKTAAREHASLLPTNWSKEGKELLLQVTGNGVLPPDDPFMNDFEWKHECDQVSKDATLLVMTHGEDFGMVPLTDKFNNRGGNWTGAYFSNQDEENGLEIRAYRSLEKGEQVYTNYKDYDQVGTPELLKDYGFVEMYPQRYIFHQQRVAFDVKEREDGTLYMRWRSKILGTNYNSPDDETLAFFRNQMVRLNDVNLELQRIASEKDRAVPENELQVVKQLCTDFMTAMALAIDDITGCPVNGECIDAETS